MNRKMNKLGVLIISLILYCLSPLWGCASDNSTELKPDIDLTLVNIVSIPWDMSLHEIEKQYPGGHFYKGNPKTKTVPSYTLPVYLKDLKRKSHLNLFRPPSNNFVERNSPLIKNLFIDCDNSELINGTIENIKENLKKNFPKGGPISKGAKQVGYFIPIGEKFSGIALRWSVNKESKSIRVIIQKEE